MAKKLKAEEKKVDSLGEVPSEVKVEPAKVEEPKAPELSLDEQFGSVAGSGKFQVVEVKPGHFRMFGPEGHKVSPVVGRDDKDEEGRSKLTFLMKNCARQEVLREQAQRLAPKKRSNIGLQ